VFDANGNMYIADSLNNFIRKIDTTGAVTTYAGIGIPAFSDGAVAGAAFHRPTSIAVDASANILYVVDTNNHAIRKIDLTANTVLTIAGGPPSTPAPGSADGLGTLSRFNSPLAIAFDRVTSNLFVADSGNNTIRKITPLTAVTTLAGLAGSAGTADGVGTSARFREPADLLRATASCTSPTRGITPFAESPAMHRLPHMEGSQESPD
jgi:serine/threonine protein kinase, bacterial